MKVLIACEFSGIVREAFAARGHDAWSCDLLPTEIPGNHIQGDVLPIINGGGWDLMIAHPPCTFLTTSANRWHLPRYKDKFPTREEDRIAAIEFFMHLMNAPIDKICLENPKGIMSSRFRKPDQMVHPYFFGDPDQKETYLWLKGLPKLTYVKESSLFEEATAVIPEYRFSKNGNRYGRLHYDNFFKDRETRWKERSRTFPGIAAAMASQWG
jgi:hypothetical protein